MNKLSLDLVGYILGFVEIDCVLLLNKLSYRFTLGRLKTCWVCNDKCNNECIKLFLSILLVKVFRYTYEP